MQRPTLRHVTIRVLYIYHPYHPSYVFHAHLTLVHLCKDSCSVRAHRASHACQRPCIPLEPIHPTSPPHSLTPSRARASLSFPLSLLQQSPSTLASAFHPPRPSRPSSSPSPPPLLTLILAANVSAPCAAREPTSNCCLLSRQLLPPPPSSLVCMCVRVEHLRAHRA
jgi:hypothetical protein